MHETCGQNFEDCVFKQRSNFFSSKCFFLSGSSSARNKKKSGVESQTRPAKKMTTFALLKATLSRRYLTMSKSDLPKVKMSKKI
jgi:hypothetical protein